MREQARYDAASDMSADAIPRSQRALIAWLGLLGVVPGAQMVFAATGASRLPAVVHLPLLLAMCSIVMTYIASPLLIYVRRAWITQGEVGR